MPKYSPDSKKKLATCHPLLQDLFNEVIKRIDVSIIWGYRDRETQNKFYQTGTSKAVWPMSKHNRTPSEAVDFAPYPINWANEKRFRYFAGIITGIAYMKRIPIRWGGDWDQDTELEPNENDLGHLELVLP